MKKASEKTVVNNIKKHLASIGACVIKTHGGQYGKSGVSDLLVCYRGRFIAIECKAPGKENTLTKLQGGFQIDVVAAGGVAFTATSVEDVKIRIDSLC